MIRAFSRGLAAALAVLIAAPAGAQEVVARAAAPEAPIEVPVGAALLSASPSPSAAASLSALSLAAPIAAPAFSAAAPIPATALPAAPAAAAPAPAADEQAALAPASAVSPAARPEPAAARVPRATAVLKSIFARARPNAPSLDAVFDGRSNAGAATAGASAVAAASSVGRPTPSRLSPSRARRAVPLAVAAAAVLLAPVPALAATAAAAASAPFTALTTASMLSALHPTATLLSAAVGVVYGLVAARRAEGGPPSSGQVFSSALRYGVIGGAGTYALMGMAQSALSGFSFAGVNPVSTALVTAALGHTAFEGKFGSATTTSADRIFSAFPAVAAAFGLNAYTIAQFVAVSSWTHALAASALSVTGLIAAFYATLFTPGRSDPNGPNQMARGFVLQSLMGGLALALSNPWFSLPFAALAVWGFWDVLTVGFAEFRSALVSLWASLFAPKTPPAPPAPAAPADGPPAPPKA